MGVRSEAGFEHFPHGADAGIRGWGPTFAVALEQVGLALTAVVTDPDRVTPCDEVAIALEAPSDDALLFDWVDALVYEMATRRMLFGRFEVHLEDHRLRARVWGEPVDRLRHEPAVEVKGPTYTELHVTHHPVRQSWVAQCVVDV